MAPAIPALEGAADSYLSAVQAGQKLEAVMRSSAALRAEMLAARSEWQWQELALEEKLDGRKAAWHMRRFALGANAWLRAIKSDPPARQSVDEQASALNDAYSMFLDYAENARPELARHHRGQRFHESRAGHHGRGATHGRQAAQRIRRAGRLPSPGGGLQCAGGGVAISWRSSLRPATR